MTLTGRKRKLVACEVKGSTRNTADKAYLLFLALSMADREMTSKRAVGESWAKLLNYL